MQRAFSPGRTWIRTARLGDHKMAVPPFKDLATRLSPFITNPHREFKTKTALVRSSQSSLAINNASRPNPPRIAPDHSPRRSRSPRRARPSKESRQEPHTRYRRRKHRLFILVPFKLQEPHTQLRRSSTVSPGSLLRMRAAWAPET
jgi:hypothetical protein